MEGSGLNKPPRHLKAIEEARAGKSLEDHNVNLFDEGGDIDEATGKKRNNSPAVTGADEKLSKRVISKEDSSEDIMGSVPETLPDDPAQLARWIAKEKARLEKKKGFKRAA